MYHGTWDGWSSIGENGVVITKHNNDTFKSYAKVVSESGKFSTTSLSNEGILIIMVEGNVKYKRIEDG